MNDKELLELAAKANNRVLRYNSIGTQDARYTWNPLEDDGAAFRLAVELGMDINVYLPTYKEAGRTYASAKELLGYGTDGYASYQMSGTSKEEHTNDAYAATRRAIVRAAAEIGKEIQ